MKRRNYEYVLSPETEAQRKVHICDGVDYNMLCGLSCNRRIWIVTKRTATCEKCIRIAGGSHG